jgi:RHS repeat-associated protein
VHLDPTNGPVIGTWYYHPTHLGSAALVTDAVGNEATRFMFMPFGEIDQEHSNGGYTITSEFTNQERDAETGLMYYRARYYDPSIGRFLSADTIVPNGADAQSYNRYAYVRNNPTRYGDPTGHCFGFCGGGFSWGDAGDDLTKQWHQTWSSTQSSWHSGFSGSDSWWQSNWHDQKQWEHGWQDNARDLDRSWKGDWHDQAMVQSGWHHIVQDDLTPDERTRRLAVLVAAIVVGIYCAGVCDTWLLDYYGIEATSVAGLMIDAGVSGFYAGFVDGYGNAMLDGASPGAALGSGITSGVITGLAAATTAGVFASINASIGDGFGFTPGNPPPQDGLFSPNSERRFVGAFALGIAATNNYTGDGSVCGSSLGPFVCGPKRN